MASPLKGAPGLLLRGRYLDFDIVEQQVYSLTDVFTVSYFPGLAQAPCDPVGRRRPTGMQGESIADGRPVEGEKVSKPRNVSIRRVARRSCGKVASKSPESFFHVWFIGWGSFLPSTTPEVPARAGRLAGRECLRRERALISRA